MIKRMHRRWFIILALIFALILDALAWLLGMYGSAYVSTGAPTYFVLMKALSPWLAILLLILGIIELRDVKHHHRERD